MANRDAELGTAREPAGAVGWTFLTNHAHVLITITGDPQSTLREVSARVGITERATQKIVADLESAGYLTRARHGRRNTYTVATGRPFRHPLEAGHAIDELLTILASTPHPS